jgi:YHS domain-containing protein
MDVKRKVDKKILYPQCIEMGMALDVVCGMQVDEKTSKWKSAYKGKTYYFCGLICKQKFDKNPGKYVTSN